jgi:diguanylate cyclase (GGDEF)-like protein
MTLHRQLLIGVSLLFFVLLAGVEAIYLANSRAQLQEQLGSQAQDAATTLALRLAILNDLSDEVLIETTLNPVFDRGYFREISVVSADGRMLVRKVLPAAQGDAPAWFTRLLPLQAPGAQSLVSSGWRQLGRVIVQTQPNFAYQQLWHAGVEMVALLLAVYAIVVATTTAFLERLLRPLREIERVAVAIGGRDFQTIGFVPRARELASVVAAMNGMSAKIKQIIAEESARAEALRREAYIDPVTSLYNRRGFERQLQSLQQSTGDVFSGALALVELQKFGDFNVRVGYQRADELLALVARSLVAACEGQAVVCGRLGGAGFAFAAINTGAEELRSLVARVCDRIGLLLSEQGLQAELHFHCGVTRHEGVLPEFSLLLASADLAVERARAQGDNTYDIETFDQTAPGGSLAWRGLIERAIEQDRIVLYGQPVLELPGRTPAHTEITVRMLRDEGEPLTAAQFLPMAARHGLIGRIDCRVLEKLLDYLARDATARNFALNISARTIADPVALRRLFALLDARPGLAGRLTFEITEFAAMHELAAAQRFSDELRRRGARLALDNFGLHQDSLMVVHALRPAYIKLSPGYTGELRSNADSRFLVASLVRIARSLDIRIYAQSVEDESLLPILAELQVSGYQGYAIARPERIA